MNQLTITIETRSLPAGHPYLWNCCINDKCGGRTFLQSFVKHLLGKSSVRPGVFEVSGVLSPTSGFMIFITLVVTGLTGAHLVTSYRTLFS